MLALLGALGRFLPNPEGMYAAPVADIKATFAGLWELEHNDEKTQRIIQKPEEFTLKELKAFARHLHDGRVLHNVHQGATISELRTLFSVRSFPRQSDRGPFTMTYFCNGLLFLFIQNWA
uniref:FABP domain-containing protein n=1 Tax=Globodera pallida TaxID=36090 RepID=A0A183C8Y2_GLOPA